MYGNEKEVEQAELTQHIDHLVAEIANQINLMRLIPQARSKITDMGENDAFSR